MEYDFKYSLRHHNRQTFPNKHILICEDDIQHQVELTTHISHMYSRQGNVRLSIVADAASAMGIIILNPPDLIILDHDLPYGNAADLIAWLKKHNHVLPILTASGWEPNNELFKTYFADYNGEFLISLKHDVIIGNNDTFIRRIIGE